MNASKPAAARASQPNGTRAGGGGGKSGGGGARKTGAGQRQTSRPSPAAPVDDGARASGTAGALDRIDGRRRAVIEAVRPSVDAGRFAAKRVVGDAVVVECDVFTDGHDRLAAVVQYRPVAADGAAEHQWRESPLHPLVNDAWIGEFRVDEIGIWEFTVLAWVDRFRTWRHDLGRREDEADIAVHLKDGVALLEEAAARAGGEDGSRLAELAGRLGDDSADVAERQALATSNEVAEPALRHPDRSLAVRADAVYRLRVDDALAGSSAWYEFFPRSTVSTSDAPLSPEAAANPPHGTFREAIDRLPYVVDLGFDVVYLPPIHPIGRIDRKGRNNTLVPGDSDVGVPWAIGAEEGGHLATHPSLGTVDDFLALVEAASGHGLEIAMDIAFQCAPDHPWVGEHPQWFRWRSDGRVQFAENPPKKYQDIYPFDFETDDWRALWEALRGVFLYWIDKGVRVFRVDNPHTKPYGFWEWVIAEIKAVRPDAIFLAEAFTRPKVMHRLAKLGFTHSYTYFTWRNTKAELEEYLGEVSRGPGADYFRPNFWPNTPDILHEFLQTGGRTGSALRYVLAATMSSNHGIYGPPFELAYVTPRGAGSEEYLDSEKYQLRHWRLDAPDSLAPLIRAVNRIRREHPALADTYDMQPHFVDNPMLLCFGKTTRKPAPTVGASALPGARRGLAWPPEAELGGAASPDDLLRGALRSARGDDGETLIVVVNLDPRFVQSGWTSLDLDALGLGEDEPFTVTDLLGGAEFRWQGRHNYVELDPGRSPAHIFLVRPDRA